MADALPVILHIGGPKAGSSALQYDLTWNPVRRAVDRPGVTYEYVALTGRGELRRGSGLTEMASRFAAHYAFSTALEPFASIPRSRIRTCVAELHLMRQEGVIPVLSYETWLHSDRGLIEAFLDALEAPVEVVAYVRNPASWLTSAYWQRHAAEALPIDEWVAAFLPYTRWAGYLQNWRTMPLVRRLTVRVAEGGIAQDFCHTIGCEASPTDVRHNMSLPGAFARFICRHQLPAEASMSELKFAWWRWVNALQDGAALTKALGRPPRVFGAGELEMIISETSAATHALLDLCEAETAERIRGDARWWSPAAVDHGLDGPDPGGLAEGGLQADTDSLLAVTLQALFAADGAWRQATFGLDEAGRVAAHRIEALEHEAVVAGVVAEHVRKDLEHRCRHLAEQLEAAQRQINKLRRRGCLPRPWLRTAA